MNPTVAQVAAAQQFYDEVCQRAEQNMLKTGKLEGSHFAAMQTVLAEWKTKAKPAGLIARLDTDTGGNLP